jgi:hypothetical protein
MPDFSVAMDKVFKGRHSDHSASPSCVYWLPAYNLSLPDLERKRRMSLRRPTVKNSILYPAAVHELGLG